MKKIKKTKLIKKNRGSYFSLEIDKKGIIGLTIMMFLTAGTIFYLGVIFGKAMRDPNNQPFDLADPVSGDKNQKEAKKIRNNLKIYDIRDKEPKVTEQEQFSNFKRDLLKKNQEADEIINSSKEVLEKSKAANQEKQAALQTIKRPQKPIKSVVESLIKPVVEKPEKTTVKIPAKPATTAPTTVNKGWSESGSNELYTIQIIATKNRERADNLRIKLQGENFDAYVKEITLQGNKVYRVRVGRRNRSEIQQLKAQLSTSIQGLGKLVVLPLR